MIREIAGLGNPTGTPSGAAADCNSQEKGSGHMSDGLSSEDDESRENYDEIDEDDSVVDFPRNVPSPGPSGDPTEDILNIDYGGDLPCSTLPPVSDKLAKIVTTWLRVTPTREKVKELFQSTLIPVNVEGLEPVKINELLYNLLPFKARLADQ